MRVFEKKWVMLKIKGHKTALLLLVDEKKVAIVSSILK